MYQVTQLLATIGPLLLIALKLGLVIGGTGSLLEAIGNWRNWPALVAVGQKLEAIGADIPKLVGKVQTLLPPPYRQFAGSGGSIACSHPPGSATCSICTLAPDDQQSQQAIAARAALLATNTVSLGSLQRRTGCFALIGGRRSLIGLALAALLLLALPGCGLLKSPFWPTVAHCAPTAPELLNQVTSILDAGGDYEAALKQLALRYGKEAVICAVEAFVGQPGVSPADVSAARARGRAFLVNSGTKVEQ